LRGDNWLRHGYLVQLAVEPGAALLKENIGPHLLRPPLLVVQLAAPILDALKGDLPAPFPLAQISVNNLEKKNNKESYSRYMNMIKMLGIL